MNSQTKLEVYTEQGCPGGFNWATQNDSKTNLMELVVSSLAMTDALAKLLIEKGVLTQEEFNAPFVI